MAARGRSRGRSAPAAAAGAPAPAPVGAAPRGRGRARGVPAAAEAPPSQQLAAMNIGAQAVTPVSSSRPANGGVRERGSRFAQIVLRPENLETTQGSGGRPVEMLTNYFELNIKNAQPFYQYHVTFLPAMDNIKLRKALVHNIEILKGCHIFDGNLLYTPLKLTELEYHVVTRREENVRIGLVLTQEVAQGSDQFIQVANIIMNEIASRHMGLERIKRDYFNPSKSITIPQHKIELYPGYEFSIRRYSHNVLLGLDIKHKIIRTDTALEFMNSIMQRSRGNQSEITKELVGSIVMTKYNNKTYRVDDVDFGTKPSDEVELKSGRISYIDYYKKNYEIIIKDSNQPLLIHRSKTKIQGNTVERQIHLVPEVCYMTGLTDNMRSDYRIMQDLAQYTRQDPDKRHKALLGFKESIMESTEAVSLLNSWGLEMSQGILDVTGRQQPPENILIKNGGTFPCDSKKESFDNITRKNFVISSAEINDSFTVICTMKDNQAATTFLETVAKVGPACGINIRGGNVVTIKSDRAEDYITAIRTNDADPKIVVCLVPNNKKDRYDAIKKHCCIDQPLPSQVLVTKNLNPKKAMSVVTKVVMQMNAKLGGELWSVHIPMKKVMYVGIDTYHDSGSQRSVGGFVASMNDLCTRYFSKTTWQPSKQELISQLEVCMTDALKQYHDKNDYYPDRIIVFRDGVGDGQLLAVKEQELRDIKTALSRLPKSPELVFVVVTKRIQQRFFLKAGSRLTNPGPGTLVDTKVTRDELFDFFLVPQSVGQGTVTPTHYNVLEFQTTLKPDHLQKIAYKLCHIYFNWTGTIRVPAVCQYAHKLAFLVGQSLHRDPSPQLANLLYYL